MQAIKSLSIIKDQISDLVIALVFASPSKVIYETESEDLAARCASLLEDHSTTVFSSRSSNRHFISIDL